MTENKRFTVDNNGKYFDRLNNRYLTIDNLLNELNELNDENKELKEQNDFLQKRIDCIIQSLQNDLNNY